MSLSVGWAMTVAAWCGFVALAYEVLWTRFYSFASQSRAQAFGALLAGYLLGLAVGALLSRLLQRKTPRDDKRARLTIAMLLLFSGLLAFVVMPIASRCIASVPFFSFPLRTLPFVIAASAALGLTLPLLCELAVPANSESGARIARVYVANIVGAGAGSLLTGFVLMDFLSLGGISTLLLALSTVVGASIAWYSKQPSLLVFLLIIAGIVGTVAGPRWHEATYERLFYGESFRSGTRFANVVETRHGVVSVDTNRTVYGGGVYDGVISTRLEAGSGLVRPYFISALHPEPRDVLVIGVSAGAWTQILVHNPHVKSVTAVEINAGYIDIIKRYPEVSSVLANPKLTLVIDDGRRWLRRHPEARFDAILMNTTFHWRDMASALLSKEFLELARSRLKPRGFVMWNCTGSARAISTGMEVFPSTIMVMNNCVGSLDPLVIDRERWRSVLEAYQIDGKPVFDLSSPNGTQDLEAVLSLVDNPSAALRARGYYLYDRKRMTRRFKAPIITDDNLGHEFDLGWRDLFGL
jgi:spermidine synthase